MLDPSLVFVIVICLVWFLRPRQDTRLLEAKKANKLLTAAQAPSLVSDLVGSEWVFYTSAKARARHTSFDDLIYHPLKEPCLACHGQLYELAWSKPGECGPSFDTIGTACANCHNLRKTGAPVPDRIKEAWTASNDFTEFLARVWPDGPALSSMEGEDRCARDREDASLPEPADSPEPQLTPAPEPTQEQLDQRCLELEGELNRARLAALRKRQTQAAGQPFRDVTVAAPQAGPDTGSPSPPSQSHTKTST